MKLSHSSLVVQPSRSSLLVWIFLCFIVALALALLIIQPALAQKKLTAAEAKDHVGETATVCGNVVSTRYAASTKGQPTFLNLDTAFSSWAFYGSGASVNLAQGERAKISFTFSALAGAFLVGVGGVKWLTNEVDKKLLKESMKEVSKKKIPPEVCEELVGQPARQILKAVEQT